MIPADPPTTEIERFVPGPGRAVALVAIAGAGIGLAAWPSLLTFAPRGLVTLLGATLVLYAVMLALSWYPIPGAARSVEKFFEGIIDRSSSGWYLVVTLGYFARAEVSNFLDFEPRELSFSGVVLGWLTSHFMSFSMASFMNALWAAMWPIRLMEDHGFAATAIFGAVVYGLYGLGARTLGEPNITSGGDEDEGEGDGVGDGDEAPG